MIALARPAAVVGDRPILSLERILHNDYDRKFSVEKLLVLSLKRFVAETNRLGGKPPVVK
jgi:hypothetical protein